MQQVPIATGFYEDDTRPIAYQQCINWVPQIPGSGSLSEMQLKGANGVKEFATTGDKSCRGLHVMDGVAYSVSGNNFYRINSDGTVASLGVIVGSGRVSMADNGVQLCLVVSGSAGYIYTVSGGLATITDTDYTTTLGPSEHVIFKDGYFLHYNNTSAASSQPIVFKSELNDGLAFNALDFATAEADPDNINGIHVSLNQWYVFGEIVTEIFQNIGGADFPYQRVEGAIIAKGISAKHTAIDFDGGMAFVGAGQNELPSVWKAVGVRLERLSSAAIESALHKLTQAQIAEMFCTTYAEDGGFFLNVHLPDRTFSYDASTSAKAGIPIWHERLSKSDEGNPIDWRVNHIVAAYAKILVGDSQSGKVGEMSRQIYTEYGVTSQRVVTTAQIHLEGAPVNFSEMELVCESGTATITGAGSDPHITREISDDGGYTWGNRTARSLGKQGDYRRRQVWRKEGQAPENRVYKFIHDEPIKASIIKLMVDLVP